jgi:hypothetical protein
MNDQLVCEECYSRLSADSGRRGVATSPRQQSASPKGTLVIGEIDETARRTASQSAQQGTDAEHQPRPVSEPVDSEGSPTTPTTAPANTSGIPELQGPSDKKVTPGPSADTAAGTEPGDKGVKLPPGQDNVVLSELIMPGESILWKRSFSKGIINRHLTFTEVVTNIRAVCIDDERLAVVRYASIRASDVSVESERREYSGVHSGYGRYGTYGGTSFGQSSTYGNLSFLENGRVVLTLYNVKDPHGLKDLIMASKKSMQSSRPTLVEKGEE